MHGVSGISDDIIVVGYKSDGSDHVANLTTVLEQSVLYGRSMQKHSVLCKHNWCI